MPKTHSAKPRLDPRQPLVLDTRELGRRPGSMRRVRADGARRRRSSGSRWPAIAAGSELVLDLRLESVMEGVLVSGTVDATMSGECGRCLDPVSAPLQVDIQELYSYPESGPYGGRARKPSSRPARR